MIADLKIRFVEINGEQRVPPECMRLLLAFADHKKVCDVCGERTLCVTGEEIMRELLKQPEVSQENVRQ